MSKDRSHARCIAFLAVALIAMLGAARPAMAQSNCCFANGSPGCDNSQCQNQICSQDPFCCNTEWDTICANAANQICAVCQQCGPACGKTNVECLSGAQYANRTFVGRFSVGCTAWIIAEPNIVITNAHCNNGSPANWSVQFNFECDSCTNGSPKPTQSFTVQSVLLVDNTRDIMIMRLNGNPAATFGVATLDPSVVTVGTPIYEIHHAAGQTKGFDDGQITGTFLNVNCPGNIQQHSVSVIASQGASGSPVFRQDNHAVTAICNCGPPCSEGFVIPMSTAFPFIQANATQNGYTLQVVGQAACGSAAAGSCCVNNGTPFCNDGACCELICAADPFCCNTSWDTACANQAIDQCVQCFACGSSEAGDCCENNGTPYCNNASCCELICAEDPFCCETSWDGLCADAAIESCTVCLSQQVGACCLPGFNCSVTSVTACLAAGGAFQGNGTNCDANPCPSGCGDPAAGSCCENNGTPFCNDGACCELICAADPFCCNTSWDTACANQAIDQCVQCFACGSSEAGDCCESNGTPFCNDAACCETVCSVDPFCCDNTWDGLCAQAAADLCDICEVCIADINGDGVVNAADLGILLNQFGCQETYDGPCAVTGPNGAGLPGCSADPACEATVCSLDPFCCETAWDNLCAEGAQQNCPPTTSNCPADINDDGIVNAADLGILLNQFGCGG